MNYDILVVAVSKGGFTENIKEVISLKEIYTSFWGECFCLDAFIISFVILISLIFVY